MLKLTVFWQARLTWDRSTTNAFIWLGLNTGQSKPQPVSAMLYYFMQGQQWDV